jgi:protein-tyrosine sulfotransferase
MKVYDSPFFIVGSGRCGTTLLRRLIMERCRTIIPPENYALAFTRRIFAACDEDWARSCAALVGRLASHPTQWATFHVDETAFLAKLVDIPEHERQPSQIWSVLAQLHALAAGISGFEAWGDKTPMNAFHLPEILALFPKGRFIFLVRDPLDMALSYGSMAANQGQFEKGLDRWVRANTAILDFYDNNGPRCQLLKYEDLVVDPNAHVEALIRWLGLDVCEVRSVGKALLDVPAFTHLANTVNPVTTASVGRGADLPAGVRKMARDLAEPLASRLGYNVGGSDLST